MTKTNYTQARIAQERTKQIIIICLALIGISVMFIPVVKGVNNVHHTITR